MDPALYTDTASRQARDFYWFTLDGCLDHLQHGVTALQLQLRRGGELWAVGVHAALNSFDQNEFHAEEDSGNPVCGMAFKLAGRRRWTPKRSLGSPKRRPPLQAFLDWSQAQPKFLPRQRLFSR